MTETRIKFYNFIVHRLINNTRISNIIIRQHISTKNVFILQQSNIQPKNNVFLVKLLY
uniref:Uncharacterized protein n=1 Tax=Rhizophagus irregularis (strain DAOM 181602 / DAOM 197198 / MUCL 43194) TaxID=747089 RepID=U9TW94_RHIID